MIFEIGATNLTDVKNAEEYGADRVELLSNMTELGITPSYGFIKKAVESVEIPVNVLIRPHNESFYYNNDDIETMIADIKMVKKIGANGIVIGSLAEDEQIDQRALKKMLQVSEGLDVTIHRAFDFARNQEEALMTLEEFSEITTILTAGGNYSAPEAVKEINYLLDISEKSNLKMMIGNGLRLENLQAFLEDIKTNRIDALHFGTGVRKNESVNKPLDEEKIRLIKKIIEQNS